MGTRDAKRPTVGEATRTHILDTAERLIGERGPGAVSIRSIAAEAGVNLNAVNYHFGSKERLLEQIFERRVVPLNARRLALLDAVERRDAPGGIRMLDAILEAFVAPSLELSAVAAGNARSMVALQFLSQTFLTSSEDTFLDNYFEPLRTRFVTALSRACPALSPQEVVWRYNFLVGAMVYAMGAPSRIRTPPRGFRSMLSASHDDLRQSIRQFVVYAAAGFDAPSLAVAAPPVEAKSVRASARGQRRCTREADAAPASVRRPD